MIVEIAEGFLTSTPVSTSEDVVFAYRPPSVGRRMMAAADDDESDKHDGLLTDDDVITVGRLRQVVREELAFNVAGLSTLCCRSN